MNSAADNKTAADCVAFWVEAGWEKWFTKNADFDDEFRQRFLDLIHENQAQVAGLQCRQTRIDGQELATYLVHA